MKMFRTRGKKRFYALGALTITSVASVSVYAWAGLKLGANVTVSGTFNATAEGTMGTVHHSASTTEFIGCYVSATSSSMGVVCSAFDSVNLINFSCTTNNADLINVVNGIHPDSHLRIRENGGACTEISAWHYSTHYGK